MSRPIRGSTLSTQGLGIYKLAHCPGPQRQCVRWKGGPGDGVGGMHEKVIWTTAHRAGMEEG